MRYHDMSIKTLWYIDLRYILIYRSTKILRYIAIYRIISRFYRYILIYRRHITIYLRYIFSFLRYIAQYIRDISQKKTQYIAIYLDISWYVAIYHDILQKIPIYHDISMNFAKLAVTNSKNDQKIFIGQKAPYLSADIFTLTK